MTETKQFMSTKTYPTNTGLTVSFRQHRAKSHCRFLHGYSLAVTLVFAADELDERNWVMDFGNLKEIRDILKENFDHKTCVAEDDPKLDVFRDLHRQKIIQLNIVKGVGCEMFADMIFDIVDKWLKKNEHFPRVRLYEVTVSEHGANAAKVRVDGALRQKEST